MISLAGAVLFCWIIWQLAPFIFWGGLFLAALALVGLVMWGLWSLNPILMVGVLFTGAFWILLIKGGQ